MAVEFSDNYFYITSTSLAPKRAVFGFLPYPRKILSIAVTCATVAAQTKKAENSSILRLNDYGVFSSTSACLTIPVKTTFKVTLKSKKKREMRCLIIVKVSTSKF